MVATETSPRGIKLHKNLKKKIREKIFLIGFLMVSIFITGFLIFSVFISSKAVSSELIGVWEHKGFACGADYRVIPKLKSKLEQKRKIFNSDNTYTAIGKTPPDLGSFICDLNTTGSYTVTGSIINIEINSANVDCDQDKSVPISMSKLLEEVMLPKNEKKVLSQNFTIAGDILYLQLSAHTPSRHYPLFPSSPKEDNFVYFQVPASTLKPPPSCKKDEKVYEVFFRVK